MILSDMKIGDEFYMDGLSFPYNDPIKTKCTLIEKRDGGEYVVDSDNCLILCYGNDKVYNSK